MIAWIEMESCDRIISCWSVGKASMIRFTVPGAVFVWSVPKTRWPVSGAVIAAAIVSRSRISPIMITSGSCRSTCRSARLKDLVSAPTSR